MLRILRPLHGTALDIIKLVAALLMVLDHANVILLNGGVTALWVLGRGAFPLFAFVVACHLTRKQPAKPYILRLIVFGLISVPLVMMAFHKIFFANILLTFSLSVIAARYFLTIKPSWFYAVALLALIWDIPASSYIEYGTVGIMLPVLLARIMKGETEFTPFAILYFIMLNAHFGETSLWGTGIGIAATFAVPIFLLYQASSFTDPKRLTGKWFFYVFYPAHLGILMLAKTLFF